MNMNVAGGVSSLARCSPILHLGCRCVIVKHACIRQLHIDQVLKDLGGDREIKRNGKVEARNAFKLFLLDEKLNLDTFKLKNEMLKLQRALHPDKFFHTDQPSKVMSDQLSAIVNDAYEMLKHPYKRAKYLLSLKTGKSMGDIENSLDKLDMDPAFISQMMDLREIIEAQSDKRKLHMLSTELESELDSIVRSLDTDLANKNYDSSLRKLGKLKFIANCHVAIMDRLGKFSDF